MSMNEWQETFIEQKVRYILEKDGKLFVIENVPARVSMETGEQFFSPETVEHIQETIWGERRPARVLETPVFEFARASEQFHKTLHPAATDFDRSLSSCGDTGCARRYILREASTEAGDARFRRREERSR